MRLTFVTGNPGKARELAGSLSGLPVEVVQDDRGYPEVQHDELRGVTSAAAGYLLATDLEPPFVLEDSGLFVAALNGFPGVYSRYVLDTIGTSGLLTLMRDLEHEMRGASFRADLCYVDGSGDAHHFAGQVDGAIATAPRGQGGFGFDPVFLPDEQPDPSRRRTFAEMSTEEKSQVSHRARAVQGLRDHLMHHALTT